MSWTRRPPAARGYVGGGATSRSGIAPVRHVGCSAEAWNAARRMMPSMGRGKSAISRVTLNAGWHAIVSRASSGAIGATCHGGTAEPCCIGGEPDRCGARQTCGVNLRRARHGGRAGASRGRDRVRPVCRSTPTGGSTDPGATTCRPRRRVTPRWHPVGCARHPASPRKPVSGTKRRRKTRRGRNRAHLSSVRAPARPALVLMPVTPNREVSWSLATAVPWLMWRSPKAVLPVPGQQSRPGGVQPQPHDHRSLPDRTAAWLAQRWHHRAGQRAHRRPGRQGW